MENRDLTNQEPTPKQMRDMAVLKMNTANEETEFFAALNSSMIQRLLAEKLRTFYNEDGSPNIKKLSIADGSIVRDLAQASRDCRAIKKAIRHK